MVSCNKGNVVIRGSLGTILAELSTITFALRGEIEEELGAEATEKFIRAAIDYAFEDDGDENSDKSELVDELINAVKKFVED